MTRRAWFPIALGVVGCALLLALGLWQLARLEWKTGVIGEIDARIGAPPAPLPAAPDPGADRYRPVTVAGALSGEGLRVLTSIAGQGPGARLVGVLVTGDRRVLVDLGFVPEGDEAPRMAESVAVAGNLHWPDEADSWTPAPSEGLWFARDVPAMAESLGTEPVLVVARTIEPALGTTPLPVDSAAIRNDHLEYAVTWFGLALVWAAMSLLLLRRSLRRPA